MSNPVTNFFLEMFQRLITRSPKFFRVLQLVAACLTFAGKVPWALERWFGVEIPPHTVQLCNDLAKGSLGFFLASLFPVSSPPVAVTASGDILKKTDEKKMPYTAAAEQSLADTKEELPTGRIIDGK